MIATQDFPAVGLPRNIRPLNVKRDLQAVADLIELAFSAQMDADGREYLRQMRRLAQEPASLRWTGGYLERGPAVQGGLVWEEDGRVIGNLSLIPHYDGSQRVYLIANVAVHPDYRGRGIGRALTQAGLDVIHRGGVRFARLQVREDNTTAYNLYLHLGFRETARRTTWMSSNDLNLTQTDDRLSFTTSSSQDWRTAEKWMHDLYPPTITWNLPLNIGRLRPGFLNDLKRALSGERVRQWSLRRDGLLTAVLTWQGAFTSSDNLWLAAPANSEEDSIRALLPYVRRIANPTRPLSMNYPAGRAVEAFQQVGYKSLHTLVWMEHDLT